MGKNVLKALKPGGYLLAFGGGGSRTFHRIACAIEDAGFELRDTTGLNSVGNQQFVAKNDNEDGTLNITIPSTKEAKQYEGRGGDSIKTCFWAYHYGKKTNKNNSCWERYDLWSGRNKHWWV